MCGQVVNDWRQHRERLIGCKVREISGCCEVVGKVLLLTNNLPTDPRIGDGGVDREGQIFVMERVSCDKFVT